MRVGRQSDKCRRECDGANTALAQLQWSSGDRRQGSRRCRDRERAAALVIVTMEGGIERDVMEADVTLR